MQLHRHAMFYQADEMLINSVMYYMRMLRWVGPKTSAVQSDIRMSTRRLGFVLSTERLNEANNKNAAKKVHLYDINQPLNSYTHLFMCLRIVLLLAITSSDKGKSILSKYLQRCFIYFFTDTSRTPTISKANYHQKLVSYLVYK